MSDTKKALSPIEAIDVYLKARIQNVDRNAPGTIKLKPERVMALVQAHVRQTPALAKCTPESIWLAAVKAMQLGLEPCSPLGHAYIVPFGTEATLIVGYKGLIALARRSGEIQDVVARIVRKGDKFSVSHGLHEDLIHEPKIDGGGEMTHVYAVLRYKGGGETFVWLTKAQVDAFRSRSRASGSGPWVTDYDAMAMKTAVRRVMTFAPITTELAEAMDDGDEIDVTPRQSPMTALPPAVPMEGIESDGAAAELVAIETKAEPAAKKKAAPAPSPDFVLLMERATGPLDEDAWEALRSDIGKAAARMTAEENAALAKALNGSGK